MKKSLKAKKLVIVLAGILVLGVLTFSALYAVRRGFWGRVPDNPGFSVPLQSKLEEVVPRDLGGSDYVELAYDKSLDGQKWMVPCFSGIGTDDAADVCRGFARGYLRKYSTYRLSDGNVIGGKFQISQDTSYVADGKTVTIVYEDEKLRGDYSLLFNVLEYDGPNEAKSACLFLIRDSSYETIQMDGVNILSKEWEEGDWAHYVLPTEKTVISIQGNRTAAKGAMSAMVEKYKEGAVADKIISSGVTISIDKTEYDKGENVKIAVDNKSDAPVLYSGSGDRFWGVEYFKDNKWTDFNSGEDGGFQLTEKNIGDACFVVLYERTSPVELKSELGLSGEWNQKICPFGSTSPDEPRTVKNVESGQYRLTFSYGSGIPADDAYGLLGIKTVYSDSFVIK